MDSRIEYDEETARTEDLFDVDEKEPIDSRDEFFRKLMKYQRRKDIKRRGR